jgi:hypothetical protein
VCLCLLDTVRLRVDVHEAAADAVVTAALLLRPRCARSQPPAGAARLPLPDCLLALSFSLPSTQRLPVSSAVLTRRPHRPRTQSVLY